MWGCWPCCFFGKPAKKDEISVKIKKGPLAGTSVHLRKESAFLYKSFYKGRQDARPLGMPRSKSMPNFVKSQPTVQPLRSATEPQQRRDIVLPNSINGRETILTSQYPLNNFLVPVQRQEPLRAESDYNDMDVNLTLLLSPKGGKINLLIRVPRTLFKVFNERESDEIKAKQWDIFQKVIQSYEADMYEAISPIDRCIRLTGQKEPKNLAAHIKGMKENNRKVYDLILFLLITYHKLPNIEQKERLRGNLRGLEEEYLFFEKLFAQIESVIPFLARI
jgi:hypothetical protein